MDIDIGIGIDKDIDIQIQIYITNSLCGMEHWIQVLESDPQVIHSKNTSY